MFKRIALMTALLVAPLALSPASAQAQETGIDQARAASANAQANGRPDAMPAGMDNLPAGQALPPGLMLTRNPAPAAEPSEPEADSGTEPEECMAEIMFIDGAYRLVDCNGNVIG